MDSTRMVTRTELIFPTEDIAGLIREMENDGWEVRLVTAGVPSGSPGGAGTVVVYEREWER